MENLKVLKCIDFKMENGFAVMLKLDIFKKKKKLSTAFFTMHDLNNCNK